MAGFVIYSFSLGFFSFPKSVFYAVFLLLRGFEDGVTPGVWDGCEGGERPLWSGWSFVFFDGSDINHDGRAKVELVEGGGSEKSLELFTGEAVCRSFEFGLRNSREEFDRRDEYSVAG